MMRHINYLKYLLRHKWFVFVACLRIGASPWLGIIHDLSKFRLSEWSPYARCFYATDGAKQYKEDDTFTLAWNDHQKRNKHHWQYWLITWDRGVTEPLPMPYRYVLEMVADWMGAGRAITGRWETKSWYESNREKIQLNPYTRGQVEAILAIYC
jgi:hypothetical protein